MNKWDYYELEAQGAPETKALFEWSENYAFPSPASLFLDLIGFSEENFGVTLCANGLPNLGYLECDYLGDALKEYATNPQGVSAWVEGWSACDE